MKRWKGSAVDGNEKRAGFAEIFALIRQTVYKGKIRQLEVGTGFDFN